MHAHTYTQSDIRKNSQTPRDLSGLEIQTNEYYLQKTNYTTNPDNLKQSNCKYVVSSVHGACRQRTEYVEQLLYATQQERSQCKLTIRFTVCTPDPLRSTQTTDSSQGNILQSSMTTYNLGANSQKLSNDLLQDRS